MGGSKLLPKVTAKNLRLSSSSVMLGLVERWFATFRSSGMIFQENFTDSE